VELVQKAFKRGEDIGITPLHAYAKARKIDIEARTFGVDLMNRALIADFLPLDLARAIGLGLMQQISPLRQLAMRLGGGQTLLGRSVSPDRQKILRDQI
jgi:2-octaprenyl-6-methoxyphenol hydroxylase